MRQVRDEREQAVVRVGPDRGRDALRAPTSLWRRSNRTPLVNSVGVRYHVAPSNRSGAGVQDPRRLRPRERVAADEPLVERGGDDRALGRADIGDRAAGGGGRQDLTDGPWQRTDGHCHEGHLRPATACASEPAPMSTAPRSSAARTTAGSLSQPLTSAPARSRAASATDPPIRPRPSDAQTAAYAASPHRGGEVVEDRDGRRPSRCSHR